jgi:hypothetical protein
MSPVSGAKVFQNLNPPVMVALSDSFPLKSWSLGRIVRARSFTADMVNEAHGTFLYDFGVALFNTGRVLSSNWP